MNKGNFRRKTLSSFEKASLTKLKRGKKPVETGCLVNFFTIKRQTGTNNFLCYAVKTDRKLIGLKSHRKSDRF